MRCLSFSLHNLVKSDNLAEECLLSCVVVHEHVSIIIEFLFKNDIHLEDEADAFRHKHQISSLCPDEKLERAVEKPPLLLLLVAPV